MVYFLSAISTHTTLQWREKAPPLRPIPPYIKRKYIPDPSQGPGHDLELLICEPKNSAPSSSRAPPLFFVHGGCGHAGVWLEWITYLYAHNYPGTIYAHSARGHGGSYTLPYIRMVFSTTFEEICHDAKICIEYANSLESTNPKRQVILIGHSSGGGVIQTLLSQSQIRASALALVGAIPSYGSYDMYYNWFLHDAWFPVRSLFHLYHSNSPLSSDSLVHSAFFGRLFPRGRAVEFRKFMPGYEAYGWPAGMYGNAFWKWIFGGGNEWLDCGRILKSVNRSADDGKAERVCVMVGKEDMMFRPWMWEREVRCYSDAWVKIRDQDGLVVDDDKGDYEQEAEIEHVQVTRSAGTRLILVNDSGHHVQNDVYADQAAEAFRQWALQV